MASTSPMPSSSEHLSDAIRALTSVLLAIAVIVVILRVYVRLYMVKSFGLDDSFIIFTLVQYFLAILGLLLTRQKALLIAGDVCIFNMIANGIGRPLASLSAPVEKSLQVVKWNTIYQVINILGALFTKISISLFILRIHKGRRFVLTVWIVLTSLALMTTLLVFIILFQCIPFHSLWQPSVRGHCISNEIPLKMSYAQSAFAIISDLFLTASPVIILWNVKITLKRKIAICGLMSLGLMATIANALRNAFIPSLTESNLTYTISPVIIVADLEFSLGVIAACIPTLMPLFKYARTRATSEKASGHCFTNPSNRQGYSQRILSGDVELRQMNPKSETRIECGSGVAPTGIHDHQEIAIPFSKSWAVEYSLA